MSYHISAVGGSVRPPYYRQAPAPEKAIQTRDQVNEIFATDRELTALQASFMIAMYDRNHVEAARIRRTINEKKKHVLENYGIIL